jgi:hypothetical protein
MQINVHLSTLRPYSFACHGTFWVTPTSVKSNFSARDIHILVSDKSFAIGVFVVERRETANC